jgi:hypothetical protein
MARRRNALLADVVGDAIAAEAVPGAGAGGAGSGVAVLAGAGAGAEPFLDAAAEEDGAPHSHAHSHTHARALMHTPEQAALAVPSAVGADGGDGAGPGPGLLAACPRIQAPAELPVVLQMILSKDHRLRAMQLLASFVGQLWGRERGGRAHSVPACTPSLSFSPIPHTPNPPHQTSAPRP